MYNMFYTRSVVSLIAAVCFYSGTEAGHAVYAVCSVVNALMLVYSLLMLVNFYEGVFNYTKNLFGLLKLLMVKISVGLITLEGLIESLLVAANKVPYNDDDSFSSDEKAQRFYCLLVLIEFAVLSFIFIYAYGIKRIEPSTAPGYVADNSSDAPAGLSFGRYFCDILKVYSVFGTLALTSDVQKPLAEDTKGENVA